MNIQNDALNVLIAFFGGACFAVVYRIPKRFFIHAALLAMLAKILIVFFEQKSHIAFAIFLTSFIVASISHLFARISGKPAQAFLIPGVMYLVPGTSLYKGFSSALANDFTGMIQSLFLALTITASISFALLLANWVVPSKRTL